MCLLTGNAAVQTLRSSGPVGLGRRAAYDEPPGILANCLVNTVLAPVGLGWRLGIRRLNLCTCVCADLMETESRLASKLHASSECIQVDGGLVEHVGVP